MTKKELKTKVCTECGKRKSIGAFYKIHPKKQSKFYFSASCKTCVSDYGKLWRGTNRDKRLIYNKEYREKNQAVLSLYNKEHGKIYYENNRDKRCAYQREYNKNNREKKAASDRLYRENNIESSRLRQANYVRQRYSSDEAFRIVTLLRSRVHNALVRGVGTKSDKTLLLLGCSVAQFKLYLQNKFTKGMSWKKLMNGEIHIDHKMPCSAFNLAKRSEQKKCFHYSNLQPLWAKDNFKKGAKIL